MKAMQIMSALSQQTRMDVFAHLVAALPGGVAAGELAVATKAAPSAISAHLAILSRAGLVKSQRAGKNVVYRAQTRPVEDLRAFLERTCAGGDA